MYLELIYVIADFPSVDKKLFDYVIVGSGPAGIHLAEKLRTAGSVLVVERGGIEDQADIGDDSYELEVTGLPYPNVGSRLATFGGTSNHWGGQSHPMSQAIFETSINGHSWPLDYAELSTHLADATKFLGLKSFPEPNRFEPISPNYQHAKNLARDEFQASNPLVRLGDARTVRTYVRDRDVQLLLNTRITQIELTESGEQVQSLVAVRGDLTRRIRGRTFVLACGGIENARLMLWSARQYSDGNPLQGGPNRLTGKYFMEHPKFRPLEVYFDRTSNMRSTNWHMLDDRKIAYMWRPSESVIQRHKLARFGALIYDRLSFDFDPEMLDSADGKYFYSREGYLRADLMMMFEQSPYEPSQVRLSSKLDKQGVPIAELHWQISPDDIAAFRKTALFFGSILSQFGNARIKVRDEFNSGNWQDGYIGVGAHHMGTTRMAHRPQEGVIDSNCKVFGLDNLFIAGSSIFARSDYVNPTLNLVAFAARLASHLMSASPRPIERLSFGKTGKDNRTLGSGWSGIEKKGVWSDGANARIKFARPQTIKRLHIAGRGYKRSRVVLKLDGKQVYDGLVSKLTGRFLSFDKGIETNVLEFEFSELTSPLARGDSPDSRQLGLFIQQLSME